jgi:hypothetical protein
MQQFGEWGVDDPPTGAPNRQTEIDVVEGHGEVSLV